MHIKKIIIDGFKSYTQKTEVEFDPKHNVVVGKNGSGKSNFLLAIQFVLSKEFIPLKGKQREDLLNKRSGIISASVEIIFDNSDKQIPNEKESLSVKRVISIKKDQFFLSGEMISTTDVLHFLEFAGFSIHNPYYIVKQGKINEFASTCKMRLQLLHEIAETKFYEDKKTDFLIALDTSQGKIKKIQDLLNTIDERERCLKKDVKELQEYEKWDKQYRAVEFIIQERNKNENEIYLKELNNKSNTLNKNHEKLKVQCQILQDDIKKSTTEFKKYKKEVENVEDKKKQLNVEQDNLLEKKSKLWFAKIDLEEDIKKYNENCQEINTKLEELNKLIGEEEKKLQTVQCQYENKLSEEEELKRKLDSAEQSRKDLCKKRGRGSQFNSKEERDLWIKEELEQLKNQIKDKENHKIILFQEIEDDKKKYAELEKKIEELEKKKLVDKNNLEDFIKRINNLKKKKEDLLVPRKELYEKRKYFTDQLTSLKENVVKLKQKLGSIFGKSIIDGQNSLQEVLKIFNDDPNKKKELTKYCGCVVENFNCNDALYKAIEEIAGQQLMHHIVETKEFGREILKEMNRQHFPGEVTFLPLDCLKVPVSDYPEDTENEKTKPLIHQLNYNHKYEKPLRKIFGTTLVCRNLEEATKFAKSYSLDCVTLEGEKATSKGRIKGGHSHNLNSSMKILREIIHISEQISSLNKELNCIKEKIKENDSEIFKCISEQQNIEARVKKTSDRFNDIKCEINIVKKEFDSINTLLVTKKNNLKQCERQLEAMDDSQKSLKTELGQNMDENVSSHDQQLLENLNDSITYNKNELIKIYNEKAEIILEKSKIENKLKINRTQKNNLVEILENLSLESKLEPLKLLKNKLQRIKTEIQQNEDNLKLLNEKAKKLHEQQNDAYSKREKLQSDEQLLLKNLAVNAKQLEKVISKINTVNKRITISSQKMFELTRPGKDLYEKFNDKSRKELTKILERTVNQLKTYQINKKALDKFNALNNGKKLLFKEKEELDRAYIQIQELMNALEIRNCEVIESTFDQISKNFTDIFKILVPTGNACLLMKAADNSNSQNDTETATESVEDNNFIGIDIKASFTRPTAMKEIKELSGGQKSLLSLAFIFAIQKCTPAPVYLFDEIDQALDFEHRKSVAEMIHKFSETAQFITTTFRPELLQQANKFHQVTIQNSTSRIQTITREKAISFLTDK